MIRGEGRGLWLLSQWSIEVQDSVLHLLEEARLVAQKGQSWTDTVSPPSSRSMPVTPLSSAAPDAQCHRWPAECAAFPSETVFIWWIPAGPELSLDWGHPLGQCVISRLNIKPLVTPVRSSLWPSGAPAPRELPHLIRSDQLSLFSEEPFPSDVVTLSVLPVSELGSCGGWEQTALNCSGILLWSTSLVVCTSLLVWRC